MIIVRAPSRCTLFGSSTDYPVWFSQYGGISINFAINQYSWMTLKSLPPFFDFKSKISYSQIEEVVHHQDIKHNIIREALLSMNISEGIDFVHQSDLFSKCGLGSSSTFATCLMHLLSIWKGIYWSQDDLARATINLEQNIIKECVGYQDTLAATYGGLNRFDYHTSGDFSVRPIFLSRDFLNYFQECSLLFFTGIHRVAHDITSNYIPSIKEKESEQLTMMEIAEDGHKALLREDLQEMGRLLTRTWEEKRKISPKITTPEVEKYYNIGKQSAWGFKLMGAGGGGSILILADPAKHDEIRANLNLVEIPFRIDWDGSKVLYVNNNGLSRA